MHIKRPAVLACIRKFFSQFESNCGCNRLFKVLAANISKKFKKTHYKRGSRSSDKLHTKFGSEQSIFDLEQEDIDPKYTLEVLSTRVEEIDLEVVEDGARIANYIDNFLSKYDKEITDIEMREFAPVNFKSTDNLITNQNDIAETTILEGIGNGELEGSSSKLVENVTDYQHRATGSSNIEDISNEETGRITPVDFMYPNYISEAKHVQSIVVEIHNEPMGRITPPPDFQSVDNLLMNLENETNELIFPDEFSDEGMGRISPIDLTSFENLLISYGTYELNTDKWARTSDGESSTDTTESQKSLAIVQDIATMDGNLSAKHEATVDSLTEEQETPCKAIIIDTVHADMPKVVGVKYSPAVYDAINTSLSEKQKSSYVLEQNDKDSDDLKVNFLHKDSPTKKLSSGTEVCIPAETTAKSSTSDYTFKRRSAYESINRDYAIIVRQLVMDRFEKDLKKCTERSSRRRLSRQSSSLSNHHEKLDIETANPNAPLEPYVNVYFNQVDGGSSTDSGLEDMTGDMLKSTSSDGSSEDKKETVEYDSQEFLREALGDEYLNATYESQDKFNVNSPPLKPQRRSMYSTEKSVGSSEISMLVSNTEGSKSEGIYSLYSTTRKPGKTRAFAARKRRVVRPLFSSVSSHYDYDYASIEQFRINPKTQELLKEISHLQNIIDQVSKALLFCRDKPKFFGDIPHIEAEKLLLLSSYKKELLNNEVNKDEYEELEQGQRVGTVKILNLKCSTKLDKTAKKKETRYYICLLHSDENVLASDITTPEANGDVTFPPNCFEFKELVSDFEINISIYGMIIERSENKKNIMGHSTRNSLRRSKKSIDSDTLLTPLFQLLGNCKIRMPDLSRNVLKLEKMPYNATINDKLVANMKSSLEIKNKTGGFLNIGTNCSIWSRRWCVLEGFHLKYWNYPSDENEMKPIGVFDLSYCLTCPVNRVNKTVCARARTFMLEMVEGTVKKTYLFSADSLMEFEEWKRQLNSILISLRNWDKLNC